MMGNSQPVREQAGKRPLRGVSQQTLAHPHGQRPAEPQSCWRLHPAPAWGRLPSLPGHCPRAVGPRRKPHIQNQRKKTFVSVCDVLPFAFFFSLFTLIFSLFLLFLLLSFPPPFLLSYKHPLLPILLSHFSLPIM